MVLLGHAGWPIHGIRAHELGVEIFFVLSGMLITSLLLTEVRRAESVDLGRFYRRRARRLLPALGVLLLSLALFTAATGRFAGRTVAVGILAAITYTTNYAQVAGVRFGPLSHLWSLSVEEHFYLVWPLVVAVVARRRSTAVGRRLAVAATVMIVVSLILRFWLVWRGAGDGWQRMYTPKRASSRRSTRWLSAGDISHPGHSHLPCPAIARSGGRHHSDRSLDGLVAGNATTPLLARRPAAHGPVCGGHMPRRT